MKMSFEQVVDLIRIERTIQDAKWGPLSEKQQSLAGYMTILENKLLTAKSSWIANVGGNYTALNEVLKIAAVAVACLQQYGNEGNPL